VSIAGAAAQALSLRGESSSRFATLSLINRAKILKVAESQKIVLPAAALLAACCV